MKIKYLRTYMIHDANTCHTLYKIQSIEPCCDEMGKHLFRGKEFSPYSIFKFGTTSPAVLISADTRNIFEIQFCPFCGQTIKLLFVGKKTFKKRTRVTMVKDVVTDWVEVKEHGGA